MLHWKDSALASAAGRQRLPNGVLGRRHFRWLRHTPTPAKRGAEILTALFTPENSTSGRSPSARRTIPAPGQIQLRVPASATEKSSQGNRRHGHDPAFPHIPRASMPSTTAGSGAPSEVAKRRGPRRLGLRCRRSDSPRSPTTLRTSRINSSLAGPRR